MVAVATARWVHPCLPPHSARCQQLGPRTCPPAAEKGGLYYGDVEVVVIDEADTMFDRGFGPEVGRAWVYVHGWLWVWAWEGFRLGWDMGGVGGLA